MPGFGQGPLPSRSSSPPPMSFPLERVDARFVASFFLFTENLANSSERRYMPLRGNDGLKRDVESVKVRGSSLKLRLPQS